MQVMKEPTHLDPEQIYQEVLQEEQQKGVSPAVAEGRAKAARVRAEHGSPHPKEPRWWPGSQPQFEGGDGAAAEAAPEVEEVEEPAAAEAPAEQPAAEAPAEQPAAAAPAEQPAAAAPAEQPAAAAPAEQPAAQVPAQQPAAAVAEQPAAAVATAEAAPAPAPTLGVKPGVPTGNRLRPEDAVATDAQFDGQRAMEQRRKLIDELIATGVPAVTAAETGRERSPWVSVLFLVVPLLAILLIVTNSETLGGGAETSAQETEEGGGGAPAEGTVVAEQSQFNTDTIELTAGEPASIPFENRDPFDHNIAIYESQSDADAQENAVFDGELISATSITYEFDAPPAGEYPFQCDLHPTTMSGTVVVE
jgi:plastocyanin